MKFGAIEAGGTKMVMAIGDENGNILERMTIPTEEPAITGPCLVDFFKGKDVAAIGVGAFGPVDLNSKSANFGKILRTPKLAWRGTSWFELMKECNCPIGLDTDVNAACLGEVMYGAGAKLDDVLYLTIGTGVGAGVWSQGSLLHGMLHPEAGHMLIQKNPKDTYEGKCPYHKNCLEGLAAGPALLGRYGVSADKLADRADVWELEAEYISQALVNYILCYSPQKIILGGGVMKQMQLFDLIRQKTAEYLNKYIETEELEQIDEYIVPAKLDGDQGIIGCIALAKKAYDEAMVKC